MLEFNQPNLSNIINRKIEIPKKLAIRIKNITGLSLYYILESDQSEVIERTKQIIMEGKND